MKYAVIIEEENGNFGAYVPDLPGCVAVGESHQEALDLIQEAIELHLEDFKDNGKTIPFPHSTLEYVNVQEA